MLTNARLPTAEKRAEKNRMDRLWRRNNPEKAFHLAHRANCVKHGITAERYAEMLIAQDGGCAICGRPETEATKILCIDHDHSCCAKHWSCGKCIRGLLCSPCNRALGGFQDDIARLQRSVEYLQNTRVDMRS